MEGAFDGESEKAEEVDMIIEGALDGEMEDTGEDEDDGEDSIINAYMVLRPGVTEGMPIPWWMGRECHRWSMLGSSTLYRSAVCALCMVVEFFNRAMAGAPQYEMQSRKSGRSRLLVLKLARTPRTAFATPPPECVQAPAWGWLYDLGMWTHPSNFLAYPLRGSDVHTDNQRSMRKLIIDIDAPVQTREAAFAMLRGWRKCVLIMCGEEL
jgi:hypothetical protein